MHAQFTLKTGQQMALTGFQAVNRQRLNALDGEQLATLAKAEELELLYTHLVSMQNFRPMVEQVAETTGPDEEAADSAPQAVADEPDLTVEGGKKPARKRNAK